jgi:hypothetical protein
LYTRNAPPGRPTFGLGGLAGTPPRDLVILLAVIFVTFTIGQFSPLLGALLSLTPLIWMRGFVWQLATYPFLGYGRAGIFFLIELLIIYMFGKDVFYQLGRRHFWRMLLWSAIGAGLVAVLLQVSLGAYSPALFANPFALMQGQRVVYVILIAAFATMNRQATILFMFVLPIQARWFLWLEILIAFMAFLQPPHDLAGFLGICTAVGLTYLYLTRRGLRRGLLRDTRLRVQRFWIQRKMNRMRKKSGLRAVPGDRGDREVRRGPWSDKIH